MSTFAINAALITATFDEVASPGPVSVPGLKVGDVMLALSSVNTTGSFGNGSLMATGFYEAIVTVDDELQQNVPTTSPGNTFTAVFLRVS